MADFLKDLKPKFIKKLEKALEMPKHDEEMEEEHETMMGVRKKQGPGFWQGDIEPKEKTKKKRHGGEGGSPKGGPVKINPGF